MIDRRSGCPDLLTKYSVVLSIFPTFALMTWKFVGRDQLGPSSVFWAVVFFYDHKVGAIWHGSECSFLRFLQSNSLIQQSYLTTDSRKEKFIYRSQTKMEFLFYFYFLYYCYYILVLQDQTWKSFGAIPTSGIL